MVRCCFFNNKLEAKTKTLPSPLPSFWLKIFFCNSEAELAALLDLCFTFRESGMCLVHFSFPLRRQLSESLNIYIFPFKNGTRNKTTFLCSSSHFLLWFPGHGFLQRTNIRRSNDQRSSNDQRLFDGVCVYRTGRSPNCLWESFLACKRQNWNSFSVVFLWHNFHAGRKNCSIGRRSHFVHSVSDWKRVP